VKSLGERFAPKEIGRINFLKGVEALVRVRRLDGSSRLGMRPDERGTTARARCTKAARSVGGMSSRAASSSASWRDGRAAPTSICWSV
jgi:hypothetical protein